MTDIIFVLDESLSMAVKYSTYIQAINSFITAQKEFNPHSLFTLVKFSSDVNVMCVDMKIRNLPEFSYEHYKPHGVTALFDAIGHVIGLKEDSLRNTIMIILTDGQDNHSSNFGINQIKEKIIELRNRGWTFVYIAAGHNAEDIGRKIGIDKCVTYNETDKSIAEVVYACNVAIGQCISNDTGMDNEYSIQEMPTDVRELLDGFRKFDL